MVLSLSLSACAACGAVTTRQNDLNYFAHAGRIIDAHVESFTGPRHFILPPDAYYIPGTGVGAFNLTIVAMHGKVVEVYFLRAKDTGGLVMSHIPGMAKFYRAERVRKFFAKIAKLWNGVCY